MSNRGLGIKAAEKCVEDGESLDFMRAILGRDEILFGSAWADGFRSVINRERDNLASETTFNANQLAAFARRLFPAMSVSGAVASELGNHPFAARVRAASDELRNVVCEMREAISRGSG